MGSLRKALKVAVALGSGGGLGLFLFLLVTPGEQRTRELLKEIPEGTKTKMLLLDTLREATETHENVAWRKDWNRRESGRAA
ncbi:ubiquinol-cytochrome-c reductase complex assembly factor 3 [Antechinus flavipes]|uniref:ubiquinol-cytochrome-c reductase complex assembly factor 3 n=1 Tax=Antechinus flavipes TaxID=38775 RepID=UPI0022355C05|nr:ubiquinol-cytochrome-c reductase complex assembly factor 3 [Antechinus flavipes]